MARSCECSGHMKLINQVNTTQQSYQACKAKIHNQPQGAVVKHAKHKVEYPEQQSSCGCRLKQCGCKI